LHPEGHVPFWLSHFKKTVVEFRKNSLEKGSEDEQRYKPAFISAENTPASQKRGLTALCRVGMKLNGEHSLPPEILGAGLAQTACGNLNVFFCLYFF